MESVRVKEADELAKLLISWGVDQGSAKAQALILIYGSTPRAVMTDRDLPQEKSAATESTAKQETAGEGRCGVSSPTKSNPGFEACERLLRSTIGSVLKGVYDTGAVDASIHRPETHRHLTRGADIYLTFNVSIAKEACTVSNVNAAPNRAK